MKTFVLSAGLLLAGGAVLTAYPQSQVSANEDGKIVKVTLNIKGMT